MHKAIALHQNHNGRSNMNSYSDASSAKWKHLMPAEADTSNLPNSTQLALRRYMKTGSLPYGNAFTRESATRYDDREPEQDEVDEEDEDEEEDGEEEDERTPERDVQRIPGSESRLGADADHYNHYRRNGSSYSDDYEESHTDESDNEYENHRPRAAVSDIRSSNSSTIDIKAREDLHRTLTNNENNDMKYTPNVHPYLPSVRILRPSQDLSEPSSSARLPEYTSNVQAFRKPAPVPQEKKADPPRAARPAPAPRPTQPAKRRREANLSDDDDGEPSSKVPKLPRPRKGGNGGQSGFKRKEYKCDMCLNFYAGSKGDLKRHHESLTHKEPSYPCEVEPCDKMFTRMDAVKRHMKNAHNYVAPVDPDADPKKASSSKSRSRSPQSDQ